MVKYVIYFCADEIAALIRAVWRYPMKVRYDKLWRLERKKQGADKKHHVIITEGQSNRARIARVIASATGESLEKAAKRLAQFPVDIAFSTKSEAVKFAKDVTNAGGKATIKTS